MLQNTEPDSQQKPRILIISMRGLYAEIFRSAEYEFEDAISHFDYADMITPVWAANWDGFIFKKIANYTGRLTGQGKLFRSGCATTSIGKEYDLLFFICQNFWDITCLNSIQGWREKCRKAIVWIDEIWVKEVREHKSRLCLTLLKDFDYIFTPHSSSVKAIHQLVQRPCVSLPYAVDTVKFCPYPQLLQRSLDFYSIGRRSPKVHKILLNLAERSNFFYLYDTTKILRMIDYKEHRALYANLIKRSRYFIVNKAKFDANEQTGGQEELGSRFFEGAAGGAVMLGTPPVCEAYQMYFDWPNAVIEISDDAQSAVAMLTELDAHPQRLMRIRRDNVVNSLLRHDWVYRWVNVLESIGLDSTPQMLTRQTHLKDLANHVLEEYSTWK